METVVPQTKRFARYEILRKLGRSMTDVYLAFDPRTARRVILKLIEESRDPYTQLIIEAERRGAQIQSELHRQDSRILEIYESGVTQGSFYISMEYFEGRNLQQILEVERRLDPERAARYAAEICSQLARLHAFVSDVNGVKRAVVHGDIKPSNIQIGGNDELRLLDFGIAKVITSTRNLTQHNLGSPTYCSPERLSKGQVDAQADLWAVGVTLYEMVAGTPPYQAQDTRKLEKLIESKRPPRSLPTNCPRGLADIISRALAGDIGRRYPNAADFERDLRAYLAGKAALGSGSAFALKPPSWWVNNATLNKWKSAAPTVRTGAGGTASSTMRTGGEKLRAVYDNVTRRVASRLPSAAVRSLTGPQSRWLRFASILTAVAVVFLMAYGVGKMRNHYWPPRASIDFSRASFADINNDWAEYQRLKQRDSFLGKLSPAVWRGREIRNNLVAAADEVIDGYRNSSDPSPNGADWARAQLCLRHASEIDPDDRAVAGKLALADGYVVLLRSPKLASRCEWSFRRAASKMPRSPDPHLALARLYVYSYLNIGKALGEFQQAERLNFHLGPREHEEQADGYLIRAESEIRQGAKLPDKSEGERYVRMGRSDLHRARDLYEPISGYSNVSANLNRLDQDQKRADELLPPETGAKDKRDDEAGRNPLERFLSHLKWQ